ncbi:MAG: thiol peroxidase [Muribaculaceae bacterium]|nr:thiol peroxidase [Muribaculaceae bacterium]
MVTVYVNGQKSHTFGFLPKVGEKAPDFHLVKNDLSEISNKDLEGKVVVLNIFPSIDTEVCAMSVRKFNMEATKYPDVVVVCVSMDLPFAQKRFCAANNIDNVIVTSAFRSPEFTKNYGVQLIDGPLSGLLARCVFVIGKDGRIEYEQLVDEITHEPNYDEVYDVLNNLTK